MRFTACEQETILAALRYWQENAVLSVRGLEQSSEAIASLMPDFFHDTKPLDAEQIDELCERINFGGTDQDDEISVANTCDDCGQRHEGECE
jgi:hypothetical protein